MSSSYEYYFTTFLSRMPGLWNLFPFFGNCFIYFNKYHTSLALFIAYSQIILICSLGETDSVFFFSPTLSYILSSQLRIFLTASSFSKAYWTKLYFWSLLISEKLIKYFYYSNFFMYICFYFYFSYLLR